jgi:lysophospholipase L1-like esterase
MSHENPPNVRGNLRSRWKSKACLLLGSTLVALLLTEIALRLVWHNPFVDQLPDRLVELRVQNARSNYTIDRRGIAPGSPTVHLRTDDRCYILPSFQYEHPAATIAFLGGSTTECSAVAEPDRFHAVVARKLAEAGLPANTLNAGKSGNTTHDCINVLFNHLLLDSPDIVVLMEAANDFGVLSVDDSYSSRMGSPYTYGNFGRFVLQSASNRSALFGLLRQLTTVRPAQARKPEQAQLRAEPNVPDSVRLNYRRRLVAFVHLCRSFDIVPVLMTQPLSSDRTELSPDWTNPSGQDSFNQTIRDVGTELDTLVIDLVRHLPDVEPRWQEPLLVFYDGIHVTDYGSRLYGEYIASQLQPIVKRLTSSESKTETNQVSPSHSSSTTQ